MGYIASMTRLKRITVYRSSAFERYAPGLLGPEGTEELVDFIAANPLAGDAVAGTGGVRKVRWARPGTGKRGGARVLYYYHDDTMPLLLLLAYSKSAVADITAEQKRRIAALVNDYVRTQKERRSRR